MQDNIYVFSCIKKRPRLFFYDGYKDRTNITSRLVNVATQTSLSDTSESMMDEELLELAKDFPEK
jgi:hypothetical protein